MKHANLTLSTALAGAFLLGSAMAHEGEVHAKAATHAPGSNETGPAEGPAAASHEGMTALYAHLQEVEILLAAGKLEGMHEHAEAIEAAAKDLNKDSTLSEAKKKRVQGYAKNVAKLADDLHDAADAKKLEETKKVFTKLKAQVDLLDRQFAHSHKPAAAAKPGTAATLPAKTTEAGK